MQSQLNNLVRISPQQKHLWLLNQTATSQAYCSQIAISIEGNLNPEILKVALENIVQRHEIFRTTFHCLPGMNIPLQSITERNNLSVLEYNWSGLTSEEQQAKIDALFKDESLRTFDITKGPLLQIALIKLSSYDYLLFVSLSDLCADMATLNNLAREISHSYVSYLQCNEVSDESMQYADISEWLNELLESEDTEIGREYWQQQDMSSVLTLNIPFENQPSEKVRFEPQSLSLKIESDTVAKLEKLATTYDTSLILLTCWKVLLWRITRQSDIVIGIGCDGRQYKELKEAFGLLTKYVPIHSHLKENLQFKELLERLGESSHYARKWQEYFDWEQLVVAHGKFADSPFFPFSFDFEEQPKSYIADNILFSVYKSYAYSDRFKIRLSGIRRNDNLLLEFYYDSNLFSLDYIEVISRQYQTLLENAVKNPECVISNLDILSNFERQQLLIDFNNTKTNYPKDKCIHQLFEEQVERTPDRIAVEFENQFLTYTELNARSNQLAHQLQTLGVRPEVLVGICVERSPEMIIGILAILKAGGAYVPLDPTYPKERLTYILEDAQVPVLLTQKWLVDNFIECKAHVVCLDTDLEENVYGTAELIAQQNNKNLVSGVNSKNLAYVIYTSGSTGKPKGTMILHQGLVNYLSWCTNTYAVAEGYGAPVQSSIGFDATITSLFSPLLVGQRVVLLPEKDEIEALAAILQSQNNFSLVKITPAHLEMLNQLLPKQEGLTQTGALVIGGEALLGKSLSFWRTNAPNTRLINEYGPTETVVGCCVYEVSHRTSISAAIPIGRPIANTQLYLLDENQRLVPIGIPGELYIGGAGVARGYLNRPELTQEKFISNPFTNKPGDRLYKTGDLARYLPDGNIEYLGRIDHQVKIRGYRIELGEIESLLGEHPSVNTVAVIAREDQPGDKRLVAYIVPHQEQALTTNELNHLLTGKLPEYMIPSAFVMLKALPVTSHGKIDRQTLPKPHISRSEMKVEFVLPRDSWELQLAEIWISLLNLDLVGVKDNFFDLGGHSLLSVRLMAQIQQQFGKNLPLATLFQSPTIEQIANILRQELNTSAWSPLVAIQPNGSKPPFFCIPGAGGNVLYFYHLARHLGSDQPFYGLQALGLDGESQPHTRIEDIANCYIQSLQTVQSEGPYFLGGHSFGGYVAFEMAQQLQKQGHKVALVAIFDTPTPLNSILPNCSEWDSATWLVYIGTIVSRLFGKELQVFYEELQLLKYEEQLQYFLERLAMIGFLPKETGITQIRGLVQVFQSNHQIRYLPQDVYPTRIALFRASEVHPEDVASAEIAEELLPTDAAWGWNDFASAPVDVHSIPGDHLSMMVDPHVQVLAAHLKTYFE